MSWKIVVPIALVVVVVVVVAAVASGDSKSDKAMAQVCGARADIAAQVKTLQGLAPGNGAADQARSSLDAIAGDIKSITEARKDLAGARRDEIQSANDAFVAGVKDAAGGVTDLASLQGAAAQVVQGAQALAQTYQSAYGKVDCSTS
jgi:hypothetical protein